MARFKQKVRTTRQSEWHLDFINRLLKFIDNHDELWTYRELSTTNEVRSQIATDLDRYTYTVRFIGSTGRDHYRIVARISNLSAWSEEGEKAEVEVFPTRIWVEHKHGTWFTHWNMVQQNEDGSFEILRSRHEQYD